MKKKQIGLIVLFLLSYLTFSSSVWAKYRIEEKFLIATIQIDRTRPNLSVQYSEEKITRENVIVTIIAEEEIQEVEGWQLKEDKKTLVKEYEKNTEEEIIVKDLAGNETKEKIIIKNIDKEAPIIFIQEITNSNQEYPNYANQEQTIKVKIQVVDDRKISGKLDASHIKIRVGEKQIEPKKKTLIYEKEEEKENLITLTLGGIIEEGKLVIEIPKGSIKDEGNHESEEVIKDTKIEIDNTKPQGVYSQQEKEQKKIEAVITANEPIRRLEGWNLEEETKLKKTFTNNLSYTTTIQDLAGNVSEVEIHITGAENIVLSYASHNSVVGWSYGYGNYDIAGMEAIKKNPIYKTESLAFRIAGNVPKDFLQAKAYVHTNWGEGSTAQCTYMKTIYHGGWNPAENEWKQETTENAIILKDKTYFQLGGAGVNREYNTDINGNGSITPEMTKQYRFGISALSLKLKKQEEYAIVYQVYIHQVGWLPTAKNGEITCYQKDKPISALRVALVPNSELKSVVTFWNKETGKIIK